MKEERERIASKRKRSQMDRSGNDSVLDESKGELVGVVTDLVLLCMFTHMYVCLYVLLTNSDSKQQCMRTKE